MRILEVICANSRKESLQIHIFLLYVWINEYTNKTLRKKENNIDDNIKSMDKF